MSKWKLFQYLRIFGSRKKPGGSHNLLRLYNFLQLGLHCSNCFFTEWKVSKCWVFSGLYFPAFGMNTEGYFGLNTERYGVSLCIQSEVYHRIQSECRKIWTRKNSVFGHFSRSVSCTLACFNFVFWLQSMCMVIDEDEVAAYNYYKYCNYYNYYNYF